MAIAPVNKFINIAVPVAPGKQKLYEVPTGTSALLLYLQVANVGIGTTFPKVTFTQQRTQRSTNNKREVRVIKDVEIPPNDAAIIVDGRLVLEKTPLVLDKIFIEGKQQQVGIITFVDYHEPSGIVSITTKDNHPFKAGDPVTLAGIAFSCIAGETGITTGIFPDPMQSYVVDDVQGVVGSSKTFSAFIGGSTPIGISGKDYSHFYMTAIHYYERSKPLAIEVVTAASGSVQNQITRSSSGPVRATASVGDGNRSGGALTGTLTITNGGAGYLSVPTVTITGGGGSNATATATVVNEVVTQITVSGGSNYSSNPTVEVALPTGTTTYEPSTGKLSVLSVNHGFQTQDIVRLKPESFAFFCATGGPSVVKKYPRASGENGTSSGASNNTGKPDFAYSRTLQVIRVHPNRFELFIGSSSDTSAHTYVPTSSLANNVIKLGTRYNVEHAVYYGGGDNTPNGVSDTKVVEGITLARGQINIKTEGNHNLDTGDKIRIVDNSIYFTCTMDNRETEHSYPRVTDPASHAELQLTKTSNTSFNVNVGPSVSGGFFAPLEMELVASILENSTA